MKNTTQPSCIHRPATVPARDLAQEHGGGKIGQVLQRDQLDDLPQTPGSMSIGNMWPEKKKFNSM